MKSQDKTIIAVLGTGSIGSRHLQVLRSMPSIQPLAIPIRPERVEEWRHQGYRAASNLKEAISEGAELLIVATDSARHCSDGLAGFASGFTSLLVEKPLGIDLVNTRSFSEATRQTHPTVFVACCMRFSESMNWFREDLPRIGPIDRVEVSHQSYLPNWRPDRDYRESYSARAKEGGVLLDFIHEIDYCGWLYGWPEHVQGETKNLGRLHIESEELAEVNWSYPKGASVSIHLDYLTQSPRRTMKAFGEKGTIMWDGHSQTVSLELVGAPLQLRKSDQSRDGMMMEQATSFLKAVQSKKDDSRLTPMSDGLKALAVCDALRNASNSKRVEPVRYETI